MEDRYAKIDFIEERKYANFEFHTYVRRVAVPQLHVFVNITWSHKLMDQIAYISWWFAWRHDHKTLHTYDTWTWSSLCIQMPGYLVAPGHQQVQCWIRWQLDTLSSRCFHHSMAFRLLRDIVGNGRRELSRYHEHSRVRTPNSWPSKIFYSILART